ncbi:four-carbon acid sugar kinase family protein [Bordetella sp. FB-8]|uniref:four-carbon acid sugar kinase family protein n=1 Tax=Bordetella sp. FB-8 TaxID=1159870 RepID=UPI00037B23A6|nr:four-carbon acid sugar kinase family protein [Bordetella sp. FB-8]
MSSPTAPDTSARRPRIAYYGDDFTGATDTLSVAVRGGLRAALFLQTPGPADLAAFGELDCVGLAGGARSWSPQEMDLRLPDIYAALAATGAQAVHYKTCSTFDSAPHVGSIGRAVRLGLRALGQSTAYIVGGQPNLGRYCAFATLYARAGQGGRVYRLDRHPTMRCHPVTPMDEADLRLHLGRQGLEGVVSFALDKLAGAAPAALDAMLADLPAAVLFDVLGDEHLAAIGRMLWGRIARSADGPALLVGPSSVEQALLTAWPGQTRETQAAVQRPAPVSAEQVFIVAGSRSPVTAQQIRRARDDGFALLDVDPRRVVQEAGENDGGPYCRELADKVVQCLRTGRSVIAQTTLTETAPAGSGPKLAAAAGRLMHQVLRRHRLARVGFAGGDTSSLAIQAWNARALTLAYTLSPGVAVCAVHSDDAVLNGVELMLKGGQMGPQDVFEALRQGRRAA